MLFDDPRLHFAGRHAAAIRAEYREQLNGGGAQQLEPLVRLLARDARASGVAAELAIVALKVSIHGEVSYAITRIATEDDQRNHVLFESLIGWVLDEYFEERTAHQGDSRKLAS